MIRIPTLLLGACLALTACEPSGENQQELANDNPPFEQSNDPEDLRLAADIRGNLLSAGGLSVVATNVQIITRDGEVVLRGPVRSSEEKESVLQIVRETAGVTRVEDRLTVGDARDLPEAAPEDGREVEQDEQGQL
jgi:hypothetical protein